MTAPSGFDATDYAEIIRGVSQGASSGLSGAARAAQTSREAKEVKRQTLANMLNKALRRQFGLFKANTDYKEDMNDYQSNALQQVARGFVDAFKG